MRKIPAVLSNTVIPLALVAAGISTQHVRAEEKPMKEWTLLVYLNGNNNLDRFGGMDINEMEKVGSTDKINIVVQWASLANGKTQRLLVKKDTNPQSVTSPILENLGNADMGDWNTLVEFVRWGVQKYPAKRYFVDVWNHGGGWHRMSLNDMRAKAAGFTPSDISWDDNTGNFISTVQLGQALDEASKIIGHKIDLYGSDACLMAMTEVSTEVKNAVQIYAGSQEVEPGEGWPYDALLAAWAKTPTASAQDVAKILTDVYVKSYQGGSQGRSDVTFSSFDLTHQDALNSAIRDLGLRIMTLSSADKSKVVEAINSSQTYAYSDYADLIDFLDKMESRSVRGIDIQTVRAVRDAAAKFVVSNGVTQGYAQSHGVSIWLPSSSYQLANYADRYRTLRFASETGWLDALTFLSQ